MLDFILLNVFVNFYSIFLSYECSPVTCFTFLKTEWKLKWNRNKMNQRKIEHRFERVNNMKKSKNEWGRTNIGYGEHTLHKPFF